MSHSSHVSHESPSAVHELPLLGTLAPTVVGVGERIALVTDAWAFTHSCSLFMRDQVPGLPAGGRDEGRRGGGGV
jgi:hypothetical protein